MRPAPRKTRRVGQKYGGRAMKRIKIEEKPQKCCLCGKMFTEYPNNPYPLSDVGVCCRECNKTKVIPERLRMVKEREGEA